MCEPVLTEIHTLLRNPTICASPLTAAEAVRKIDNHRKNPAWALLDHPGGLMDDIWKRAARAEAYRRIFEIRLALTLRHHGVTEFASANVKDFEGFGFKRVWNPLAG